jgi:hypothetical protein
MRFWVMAAALLVTLALGYLRFVRARDRDETPSPSIGSEPGAAPDVLSRVDALERRIDAAAESLRGKDGG